MNNNFEKNRLPFIDNKVFIRDYINIKTFIPFIIIIFFYCFLFSVKIDILSFEQAIFIIISAIILFFNESLISNSAIAKITNLLNNLTKKEIKNIVFSKIGKEEGEIEPNYDEYLKILKNRINNFKHDIETFRRKSYKLYSYFTISGFIAIILSITTIRHTILGPNLLPIIHVLHHLKPYLIELCIIFQMFLIPIWIISAYQTEKIKNNVLSFFENPSKIVEDFKKYLDEIDNKKIGAFINND
jgi:hypothetical protein